MAGIIFNIQESLNNSAFNILQEPVKMILENEVEAFEKSSIIDKVFVMKTTDKYREEYRSTTTMDGFRPTEDMEVAGLSDFQEGYSKQFVFQTWTNSFVVSKQTMEDNQMMTIEPKAMGFIKSYGRTREEYAVNMIGAALGGELSEKQKALKITKNSGLGMDTVTGDIDGTKQQYFHNQHKGVKINGKSLVTQSNKFYANLDLANGNIGNLEERVLDAIEQVASKAKKYKDDKGNIVPVNFTRIVLGEDYRLNDILMRGLKSKYGSPMGGNGVNLVFGKYEVVTNPYLSDVEGFKDTNHGLILIDPQRNREGLGAVWFDRTPLEVRSYKDDKTEANVWSGRARFGAGFGDWRAMAYLAFTSVAPANADEITPVVTGVSLSKNVQ
jgi:hypothetical protein